MKQVSLKFLLIPGNALGPGEVTHRCQNLCDGLSAGMGDPGRGEYGRAARIPRQRGAVHPCVEGNVLSAHMQFFTQEVVQSSKLC